MTSPRGRDAVTPVLVGANVLVTVWLACNLNFWVDEAFSLATSGDGVREAARRAITFEVQPPLYFILLAFVRSISDGVLAVRLLSIVSIAAFLLVATNLARRYVPYVDPRWLLAALAFHPFVLWAAVETRPYALALLLGALAMLTFFDGYLDDVPKARDRVLYTALAVLGLYTHYYLGFLLVAHAVLLIAERKWRLLSIYSGHMAIAGVLSAPLVWGLHQQIATHGTMIAVGASTLEAAQFLRLRLQEYLYATRLHGGPWVLWAVRAGELGAFVALYLAFRTKKPNAGLVRLLLVVGVITILFIGVVRALGTGLMESRHSTVLFLPTILGLFALLAASRSQRLMIGLGLITVVLSIASDFATYRPLAKPGDWRRVAAYLGEHGPVDVPVFVSHGGGALPLHYYDAGRHTVIALPRPNDLEHYDLENYVLHSDEEIEAVLAGTDHENAIWLVTDEVCSYLGVDFGCSARESFVRRHFEVITSATFYKSSVRLLAPKREANR